MGIVTMNNVKASLPPDARCFFQGGLADLTINAGSYTANLDASASSDPDGNIVTYIWERKKDSGDWISIGSTSIPSKTNIVSITGTYLYRVRVIDNTGLEDVSGNITLNFSQEAVINCTAFINGKSNHSTESFNLGSNPFFDGRDSNPGNSNASIVAYSWTILSKPTGAFNASIQPNTGAQAGGVFFDVAGTYNVRLEVTSSNGTTDSNTIDIFIS